MLLRVVPLLVRKPSEHIALVLPGEDVLPHGVRTARVETKGVYTTHSLQAANREHRKRGEGKYQQLGSPVRDSLVLHCYLSLLMVK